MTKHTPDEQLFWDAMFQLLYPPCVKRHGKKGAPYCRHLTADEASACLEERRRSANDNGRSAQGK